MNDTAEVIHPETRPDPRVPPAVAAAIVKVMRGVKQLGFDERNEHSKYSYASIDKFLSAMRPLCAEAGIWIYLDEADFEIRPPQGDSKTGYLFLTYEVWTVHESGVAWGPLTRRLAIPATGPQAFGAAESYILKRFMRNLFQVPTGEKDADELGEGSIPETRGRKPQARPIAKPAAPPHDPVSGETLKPHLIPEQNTAIERGALLIAAVRAAQTQAQLEEWRQHNKVWVEALGPKALNSVARAFTETAAKLGPEARDAYEQAVRLAATVSDEPELLGADEASGALA